jgi:hypothetical protein
MHIQITDFGSAKILGKEDNGKLELNKLQWHMKYVM